VLHFFSFNLAIEEVMLKGLAPSKLTTSE